MTSSGSPVHADTPPSREEDAVVDMNSLPDLKNRIQELLHTTLDHSSITAMQERLLLKQRSSYHFVIQCEEQSTSVSIDMLKSLLGLHRLQDVKDWMRTHIELLLAYLEMLFQEITFSRQNLEAFVAKSEQVEVDADEVASAEQQLQQIQLHIGDFETKMARNLEPLTINSLFLFHMRGSFTYPVQMSVVNLGPVMFHREKSKLTPNSIFICWYIAGEQSAEPECVFLVEMTSTAPEEKLLKEVICLKCEHSAQNLKPDTCFTFTVKRMTNLTSVYEPWTDTLHLKTLSSDSDSTTEPQGMPVTNQTN